MSDERTMGDITPVDDEFKALASIVETLQSLPLEARRRILEALFTARLPAKTARTLAYRPMRQRAICRTPLAERMKREELFTKHIMTQAALSEATARISELTRERDALAAERDALADRLTEFRTKMAAYGSGGRSDR